jgi:hypothetical protein
MRLIGYLAIFFFSASLFAADGLIYAKDGSGVYGYKDTPKLPWCDYVVHDPDRPAPKRVDPGPAPGIAPIPADAVVLFNGKDLSQWNASQWKLENGEIVAAAGSLTSKEKFGDMQLHVEWMAPANYEGPWYNRGNNGVLIMGLYEIQIFDSYNEKLYPDGQCAAVYAQTPPMVNATRKPGEWQTFDILFTAPHYEGDREIAPPRITMLHNGTLVHLNQQIYGETGHRVVPGHTRKYSTGPLILAGHDCPVRFRSIWLRKL